MEAREETMELGQNITATIEVDKLTLVIDLGTTIGVSKSGKCDRHHIR